jgi:hypothetical protein
MCVAFEGLIVLLRWHISSFSVDLDENRGIMETLIRRSCLQDGLKWASLTYENMGKN